MPNTFDSLPSRFVVAIFLAVFVVGFCSTTTAAQGKKQAQKKADAQQAELEKIQAKVKASFEHVFKLKVSAGEFDRVDELVVVPIWFKDINTYPIEMVDDEGNKIYGELGRPQVRKFFSMIKGLTDPAEAEKLKVPVELTFHLSKLEAGKSITYTCRRVKADVPPRPYKWDDDSKKIATLNFDDKPIFRSMYEKVDNSSQERREATYKVFHHVFSPDGSQLLTKGPGGKFPHHRGIFFGYNRISYNFLGEQKKADTWHLRKGESQIAESMIHISGVTGGRCIATNSWKGQNDLAFAIENRDMLFYKSGESTCVDIRISLNPLGPVDLAGDPQHAGVQFRASQLVPDHTAEMTYYLRPDGKANPGEFRNWSGKGKETEINKSHINLPWHAVCFALPKVDDSGKVDAENAQRYTVCYLSADSNPKPARFSERDYGRFGSYIPTKISPDEPLELDYRYWIFKGEKTVEEVAALSARYQNPVSVELVE